MDRRFLTVLGLSLVLALVVSLVFYQLVAAKGPSQPKKSATTPVVVASRPLPVGQPIAKEDVRLAEVPAEQFPKGGFSKVEEVVGRPVRFNILLDEPVLEGRLAKHGSGVGIAPVIPVGMRAVSVRVTDVAGVAGFVLPGLRVDVLVTGTPPDSHEVITTTCLQNILVLSAGQTIEPDDKGQAIQTPTVTLLVTPEQAEVLTLAGNHGNVQLVLRNSGDQSVQETSGSRLSVLYQTKGAPAKPAVDGAVAVPARKREPVRTAAALPPPIPVPAPAPPPQIVVIRGNQRTVETVPSGAIQTP